MVLDDHWNKFVEMVKIVKNKIFLPEGLASVAYIEHSVKMMRKTIMGLSFFQQRNNSFLGTNMLLETGDYIQTMILLK